MCTSSFRGRSHRPGKRASEGTPWPPQTPGSRGSTARKLARPKTGYHCVGNPSRPEAPRAHGEDATDLPPHATRIARSWNARTTP